MKKILLFICFLASLSGHSQCVPAAPLDSSYSFLPAIERRIQLSWQDASSYHYSYLPLSYFTFQSSIAGLRSMITASPSALYYTGDIGMEGFWRYVPSGTHADNLGGYLVSSSGLHFERVMGNSIVNPTWFGASTSSSDNTTAIKAAVDFIGLRASAGAEGGILHFTYGTWKSTKIDIPYNNVIIEGEGRSTFITAPSSTTVSTMFNWSMPGVRGEGGGIRNISIYGNSGHLQWGVFLDSWRYWTADNVQCRDQVQGFLDAVGNQTSYGEHITVNNCDGITASGGSSATHFFIRFRAGAAGTWTECSIHDILVVNVDSAAIVLDGCQRFTVTQIAGANNTTNFFETLLITNTRVMTQTADAGLHTVQGVYYEAQSGLGTYASNQAVLIESPIGQTGFNRYNQIRDVAVNPRSGVAAIRFKNSSATPFLTSGNTFYSYKGNVDSAGTIYIDNNVVDTHIFTTGGTNKVSQITDNGLRTVVNYARQAAWGAGNAPQTNQVDVGDMARNTDDNSIWWVDRTGTPRRVDALNKADKVGTGDIEITDATKGIILKSPNGTRWRITIDNTGTIIKTSL